jgi:hypothetical protein
MQRINFFVIALLLFCVHSVGNAQAANQQRTKIAIVGLVHSHCWGLCDEAESDAPTRRLDRDRWYLRRQSGIARLHLSRHSQVIK